MKKLACLLLAASAALLGASASMTWFVVEAFDDKAGRISADVSGATWSKELVAVALVAAAACIAGLVLRRGGRRLIGIASAAITAFGALPVITALVSEPDTQRMHKLLTERDDQGVQTLTTWASIETMDLQMLAPVIGLLGCAVGVVGGVLLAMRPGADMQDKYERSTTREIDEDPDSERAMWDAMDADIDPTDR